MDHNKKRELAIAATNIRKSVVEAVTAAGSGHPGGSLSISDIMAFLYFSEMHIDIANPKEPGRDRFVMSKGHCSPALYATLAEKGFFPKADLLTFRQANSYLEGHPNMDKVPGCDMSTGSLGQGISAAVGMALAGKIDQKDYHVFAMLGDGELQEGEVWEAAMCAAHYQLDNLIAFVDHNGLQIDGKTTEVMNPEPIPEKFMAFGWNVLSINAHDFDDIEMAIHSAKVNTGKPTMIVANSIKGKGVSFMENQASWHGTAPKPEQRDQAIAELDAFLATL